MLLDFGKILVGLGFDRSICGWRIERSFGIGSELRSLLNLDFKLSRASCSAARRSRGIVSCCG